MFLELLEIIINVHNHFLCQCTIPWQINMALNLMQHFTSAALSRYKKQVFSTVVCTSLSWCIENFARQSNLLIKLPEDNHSKYL